MVRDYDFLIHIISDKSFRITLRVSSWYNKLKRVFWQRFIRKVQVYYGKKEENKKAQGHDDTEGPGGERGLLDG